MDITSLRLHVVIDLLATSFYFSYEISICRCHRRSTGKYNWISNRISISDDDAVGTDEDAQISSQLFAPQFLSDVRPPESRLNSSINWWEKLWENSSNFSEQRLRSDLMKNFSFAFLFHPTSEVKVYFPYTLESFSGLSGASVKMETVFLWA